MLTVTNKPKPVVPHPESFFDTLKNLKTNNSILDGIILATIFFIITAVCIIIYRWFSSSTDVEFFKEDEIEKAKINFIPNDLELYDQNGNNKTPDSFKKSENSINTLIDYILKCDQKYFFLIAPTGVGKTTFLSNFYSRYTTKSRMSLKRPLLFGHIFDEDTQTEITNRKSKKGDRPLDRLKYLLSKPKRTILLLDGLDEYNNINHLNREEFWRDLNQEWNKIQKQLSSYGKVIISVREQFLQQYNESKAGLNSFSINNKPIHYLKLKPFRDAQITSYLEKRFKTPKKRNEIEIILHYFKRNALKDGNDTLFSIPLILSYIEDLTKDALLKAAKQRNRIIADRYDVYSVIIEKWLVREAGKLVSDDELKLSVSFCEELAFKMITSSNKIFSLSESEFIKLEATYFSKASKIIRKSFIAHLGDRSLLVKQGFDDNSIVRFAHLSFMEYFFASYSLKKGQIKTASPVGNQFEKIDNILGNQLFSFASEMLITWSWQKIKDNLNLRPADRNEKVVNEFGDFENTPSISTLKNWLVFVQSITPYKSVNKLLQADFEVIMNDIDSQWREVFYPLKDMVINNSNFFDDGSPSKITQEAVKYLKSLISKLRIKEQINVFDQDLECFDGIDNLKVLSIEITSITKVGLEYFRNCQHTLRDLILTANKLCDDDLSVFQTFLNIRKLFLGYNNLNGEFIQYFKRCWNSIDGLFIEGNSYDDAYGIIKQIPVNKKWTAVGIGRADIDTIYNSFLADSKETLINLRLIDIYLHDEELGFLSEFTSIFRLELAENMLTGANFNVLLPMKEKLRFLFLRNNLNLNADSLKLFLDFPVLEKIYIEGCPQQNPDIIAALMLKGVDVII